MAAGGGLSAGTLFINVIPRTAGFGTALASQINGVGKAAAAQLGKVGRSMQSAGRTMTRSFTLPILAATGASVKLAVDFEASMTRVQALSNTTAKQFAGFEKQVLDMAKATGRAPIELANALYFLASAGLKTSQIMPALEASAKGAAIGMGTVEDIGSTLAAVLNAYAESGITAAGAMDIIVRAIKAGRAEPAEFANSLGRILPIASRLKVGFDDLAAGIASLTNIGLDSHEAVTALRQALNNLGAPGTQAKNAMKDVGISAQQVLDILRKPEGLHKAFLFVDKAIKKSSSGQAEYIGNLRKIIPNIRALAGVLGLTGEDAADVAKVFRRVARDAEGLDLSFRQTSVTAQQKMRVALSELQVVGISVGKTLVPHLVKIVQGIAKLARGFLDLSPATQGFILKAALVVAALGPIIYVFGTLIRVTGFVVTAFRVLNLATLGVTKAIVGMRVQQTAQQLQLFGTAAGTAATGLKGMALGVLKSLGPVALLVGAIYGIPKAWHDATTSAKEFRRELSKALADAIPQETVDTLGLAMMLLQEYGGDAEAVTRQVAAMSQAQREVAISTIGVSRRVIELNTILGKGNRTLKQGERNSIESALATGRYGLALKLLEKELKQAEKAVRKHGRGLDSVSNQVSRGVKIQNVAWQRAQKSLKDYHKGLEKQKKAVGILGETQAREGGRFVSTLNKQSDKVRTNNARLQTAAQRAKNATENLKGFKDALRGAAGNAATLGEVMVPLNAKLAEFERRVLDAKAALASSPPGWFFHIAAGYVLELSSGLFYAAEGFDKITDRIENSRDRLNEFQDKNRDLKEELKDLENQEEKLSKKEQKRVATLRELIKGNTKEINSFKKYRAHLIGLEKTLATLSDAYDRLTESAKEMRDAVAGGFSGFAAISNIEEGAHTPAGVVAFFQDRITQAQAWSDALTQLTNQGLDAGLLQQLAEAGPESLGLAQAIQQAGVGTVNALQGTLDSISKTTQDMIEKTLFGTELDKLAVQVDTFVLELEKLTKAIMKAVGTGGGGSGSSGGDGGGGRRTIHGVIHVAVNQGGHKHPDKAGDQRWKHETKHSGGWTQEGDVTGAGEFVVQKSAARRLGALLPLLNRIHTMPMSESFQSENGDEGGSSGGGSRGGGGGRGGGISGPVTITGTLDITPNGRAVIRGIARSVVDADKRYGGRR